jgi:hypothetical protein
MHEKKADIRGFLTKEVQMAEDGQAIYEFIQNAADCDTTHCWLFFDDEQFLVLNTGAPFTAAGISSILNVGQSEGKLTPELVCLPGAIRGLVTVSQYAGLPAFRLSRTFRLPPQAVRFTGLFYGNDLNSAETSNGVFALATSSPLLRQVLHPAGGPVLIPLDLPAGEESPTPALLLIQQLVADLFQTVQPLSVAILTHRRATSRSI